jgi:hypothetical protein
MIRIHNPWGNELPSGLQKALGWPPNVIYDDYLF